jgi:CDP-2,3-bis-(O-geranylgeranyl)-sn-glycerol synthase
MSIQMLVILQGLILISAANMAPVVCKRLWGTRFAGAIDGGLVLRDGHPLLGPSKTWRGVVAAIVLACCAAVLIGLPLQVGALAAAFAMVGDCVSSFLKRRVGLESSSMSLGLDQIPEALLPAIACRMYLPLGSVDIIAIMAVFFAEQLALSRLSFAIGLRDRPY